MYMYTDALCIDWVMCIDLHFSWDDIDVAHIESFYTKKRDFTFVEIENKTTKY